eukprot:4202145-Prymnesium_polylepis.1
MPSSSLGGGAPTAAARCITKASACTQFSTTSGSTDSIFAAFAYIFVIGACCRSSATAARQNSSRYSTESEPMKR